jgi:enoyl-CoA hydratase/carnithine racemase
MTYADIAISIEDGIGVLSLKRPEASNAVRPQTLQEMCSALDTLTTDSAVRAIILRGEGKHFCAGADLTFLDEMTRAPPLQIQQEIYAHFQGAARRLYDCPKPTLALVAGSALTVGCELALACDFRLAADDARFQESWIKLGLQPPLGGLFLLPRMIGLGRAAQMVLRGDPVTAAAALPMGLVCEVVPRDQLDKRGLEFAMELSRLPPTAYAAVKQGLHRGLDSSIQNEWSANVFGQALLLSSNDFREGLAAVKERRPGTFTGT